MLKKELTVGWVATADLVGDRGLTDLTELRFGRRKKSLAPSRFCGSPRSACFARSDVPAR